MPLNVFAFYNGLNEQAKGYTYFKRYGSIIRQLDIFQIPIQNNGTLLGRPSRRLITEAHAMGIKVLLTVSNLTAAGRFSTALLGRLVRDQNFADYVWGNIRNLLAEYQFDGINLDLEKGKPEDRALFSQLIQTWSAKFRQANYLVSIDVPAKSSDEPYDPWKGAFDFKIIGQAVDEVILMTYEEHWPGSPPGSVASLSWVNANLNYALANIPASKIYMGIPLYGYDWPERGTAQVIGYQRAIDLAKRFGAPLRWDAKQHSLYFHYETMGIRHTVYFEDPRSLKDKLDLALSKGIRGVAIWEMNLSYPAFWEVLQAYSAR
ncbi:glycosyl hydrolase family 18 protein [Desulfosporosinus sp. PR]|uniref:glycosyl hydrolase family 18 protein n=1 Tax=Candidatus Desulfosporosinus nitrosoreducens TaxID=3401928 RepID=UPI0027FDCD1F|nr:glycosyl hydrolase family 18 protein [Desulfosporosinus sp. PR]MDQ7092569.1 glycosyl hydrolase family 18 protein [Desulfosporosinus sp. PR]